MILLMSASFHSVDAVLSDRICQTSLQIWHQNMGRTAKSSYAWNMQVYTGKPPGEASEKNQGMLEVTEGLQGHNIMWQLLRCGHLHQGGISERI